MPPTIHSNQRDSRNKRSSRRQGLICQFKYTNTLPEVPFDPKPIAYPFDINRFVQYNPTSLERGYKFDLHTEHDLGIPIDLVDPEAYNIDPNAQVDAEDEYLLEDESSASLDSKRSQSHRKNVSWLRKTEYISTEYHRMAQVANKHEAKVGYHLMKKKISDEVLYKDRDSQVKAINATFNDAAQPITEHYSKPNVTPLEVLPIFPDFEMWKHPCAQVIFDSDPAPPGMPPPEQMDLMSQAIICGEQFVSYFLPTPETLLKRKRDADFGTDYEEHEEYDYQMTREYNWTIKNKSSRDYIENYFFVNRDGVIYYNELETRVRLNKRRKMGASQSEGKTRLVVKHRPLTSEEVATQEARSSILEAMVDEEEEVDFPAHEEEEKQEESDQEKVKENEDVSDKESEKNEKEEEDEETGKKEEGDDDDAEKSAGGWEKAGGVSDDDDEEEERDKEKELIFGSESSEESD